MALFLCLLIFIYQADTVLSQCDVDNCDPNYCNGTSCDKCLAGSYKHATEDKCELCYLYCKQCLGSLCYSCVSSDCSSDICHHANCATAACSGNTNVACSSCPDGFYNNNNRCYRCNNVNCKCTAASNCIGCLPWHHGLSNFCNNNCSTDCVTCSSSTQCTECVAGKYGLSCEHDCHITCGGGTCDKDSGICSGQCASNQYIDTAGACQNCPNRCDSCVNSTYCTECDRHYRWGPTCARDCTGCYNQCNRSLGCSTGCDSNDYFQFYNPYQHGYECKHCPNGCSSCKNATECTSCNNGNWGNLCQYSCDSCSGDCDVITGCGEKCIFAHYPIQMDTGYECKPCSARCEQCVNSSTCLVCETEYYVDDINSNCITCPLNCKDNKCISTNGICVNGCESAGQTGFRCDEECPEQCVECDQFNSSHCLSCKNEYYGESCKQSCSKNCKPQNGVHECQIEDGLCVYGCLDAYWTETCTKACSEGCVNHLCNETNGVCLEGCKSNFYGDLCESQCSTHCLNVSASDRDCDTRDGSCFGECQYGWYGATCSFQCRDSCYQKRCFQDNGTCVFECVVGSTDSRCIEATSSTSIPTTQTSARTETQPGTGGDDEGSIAGPAGAGVGAAVIIIVVVVVVLFLRRRKRERENDGISLDNPKHSLAIAKNAYETINETKSRNSLDGVDTIILNDTSPVIMTKAPDDIDNSQRSVHKKTPNAPGTKNCNDSKKPKDDKPKNIQQQENNDINLVHLDFQTDAQKTLLDNLKPLNKSNSDTVHLNKVQPTDTEKATEVVTNTEPTVKSSKELEETDDIDTIIKPDENHIREDVDEDDNTYYNTIGKRVQIPDLADYINSKSYESIVNEFEKLPRGLLKPYSAAKTSRNTEKNRYKMIYPYDESRVVLYDGGNDYVNASFIEGFNKPKEYIASAGPFKRKDKTETTTDFWRMIWQEKCETIVMLTKCFENTEQKCDQYWPELGENKWYGKVHVTCVTEDQYADFTVRSFIVKQNETSMNTRQIHFTAWPDKGVPADVTCMIDYRQKIRSLHKEKASPILVHCSAGIGRTGTFIALDIQTFVGETKRYVDIFGCVSNLRQQRVNLVQTPEQYEYLHHAILYALTFDCKSIPAEDFNTYYSKIIKKKDGSRQIDHQFKNLTSTLDALSVEDKDAISRNRALKDKNRDGADIPGDEHRVRLFEDRKSGSSDYINAVFLNGFKTCNKFIVAQTPMPTTVVDFLSMIHQTDCSCIVTMEETDLQDKTVGVFWLADNQVVKHGIFQVRCKESKTNENYTLKKLSFVRRAGKKEEVKDVHLFIFTNWPRDAAAPKSSDSLIQFIKDVEKANRHDEDEDERPIIVHCMTGAERSCLYSAVSVLIEKLEIEHEVSVVNTLRQIKSRRRSAFPTLDQFKFCHQAVISYLQTFDTYSNFELKSQPSSEAAADVVYATVQK